MKNNVFFLLIKTIFSDAGCLSRSALLIMAHLKREQSMFYPIVHNDEHGNGSEGAAE